MMPGIIISFILSEQVALIFRTSPSQYQLACESQVIDDAAHWFSVQISSTNLPWSTWSGLLALK
jgi:hypothetical protein